MLQRLREKSGSESGFTLVELLVVMLILGILAAIAIPSFFNQRDKARDSDAKADARTAQTAIETYATDNGGSYTGAAVGAVGTPGTLVDIEPTLADAAARMTLSGLGARTYTITVDSVNTPNTFTISRAANGSTSLTCDVDGSDGCPTDGTWSD
jgi:type IV pilus assembly protein PilA